MEADKAAQLREPFPPAMIGKLPRGGIQLDYVGHAAVCDRLLKVDPEWVWEPDRTSDGRWDVQFVGNEAVLTGHLIVCGHARPCVGIVAKNAFELYKQLQSDAIRNGAMRFGVALDLWSKEELSSGSGPSLPASGEGGSAPGSTTTHGQSKDPRPATNGRPAATPAGGAGVRGGGEPSPPAAPSPPKQQMCAICDKQMTTAGREWEGGLAHVACISRQKLEPSPDNPATAIKEQLEPVYDPGEEPF